ncbi:MAG: zinc ribbon domain-containing protein [bacterium]|nr:zinc ribbon domain-containing protein [bacterium]
MPAYEYRCNTCGTPTTYFYKTIADYEAGLATQRCPACGSTELTRTIRRVAIAKPGKNYAAMSSNEMLSVFENGDPREVGRMIHEVGGDQALNDPAMADAASRLMKGDNPEKVERDLSAHTSQSQ